MSIVGGPDDVVLRGLRSAVEIDILDDSETEVRIDLVGEGQNSIDITLPGTGTSGTGGGGGGGGGGGSEVLISDTVPTPVDDLPELWMDLTGNVSDIPFIEGPTGPTGPTGPSGVWVSMTQAAYDALPVKDPDTLYVIVG